jgi:hypothetical protein
MTKASVTEVSNVGGKYEAQVQELNEELDNHEFHIAEWQRRIQELSGGNPDALEKGGHVVHEKTIEDFTETDITDSTYDENNNSLISVGSWLGETAIKQEHDVIEAPIEAPESVEVLEPGLTIIRNLVSDEECQRLANMALAMGEQGECGFYTVNKDKKKTLNTGDAGRGRIYDAASRFSPSLINHSTHAVSLARCHDAGMPDMTCTHVLLNMYTNREGLVWHRDIYENDGKSNHDPRVRLPASITMTTRSRSLRFDRVIVSCLEAVAD